jgi:hypothetical protein
MATLVTVSVEDVATTDFLFLTNELPLLVEDVLLVTRRWSPLSTVERHCFAFIVWLWLTGMRMTKIVVLVVMVLYLGR